MRNIGMRNVKLVKCVHSDYTHGRPNQAWYTANVRVRLGLVLGLGLEFAHGRACASLLTLALYHASFVYTYALAGRVYNISQMCNVQCVRKLHYG